jgi:RNA polymerase sigma-70 factor (ECF subfamily)
MKEPTVMPIVAHALAELCGLRPYLMRVAAARMRDRDAVEEVVQETLAAACAGAARFEGRSRLRTWVTGILLHKVTDAFRAGSREVALPEAPEGADADFDDAGAWRARFDPWTDPEHALDRKRFRLALERAVAALPAMQGRAFRLRELEGLESPQICAALDITEANLHVLLHRARLGLRRSLDRDWFTRAA